MSDSFNSPNQLSFGKSQESAAEPNILEMDVTQAVAASDWEDFEDDLEDLDALEAIAFSDDESCVEEEASFEVIADYIEAEVATTIAIEAEAAAAITETSLESNESSIALESKLEAASNLSEADNAEMTEQNHLDTDNEASSTEEEITEPSAGPLVSADTEEAEVAPPEAMDDSSEELAEVDYISFVTLDADGDVETDAEEGEQEEEITESFTTPVEVVDVEILESQEQEQSYEVHQDGTLTYFQYFLDEEDSSVGPDNGQWRDEANSSPRSFVSATAVGVGVLAATFGAGLLMAEATNRNSVSDSQKEGSETQAKTNTERKASEASELAKASSPETTMPDWSATQKAIAVSQGSAQANPSLGSAAAMLQSKTGPATSSVTSKLAPAQSWSSSIPLPSRNLSTASLPVVSTASLPTPSAASLPTPTTAPADLSTLQPVPSYQVIQPSSSTASSTPLPSPPIYTTSQPDEQQLRARMAALRTRIADPIEANTVPVATDGNLLDGPDENWVSNLPRQANVPINENGTSLESAFESPELPTLTDSPYGNATADNTPRVISPSVASVDETVPSPIAAAPQAYPLDLNPVVPPHQASSLDQKVVAPVAGLLPTPVLPAQSEPLTPRDSATPPQAAEQVETTSPDSPSDTIPERVTMEVTPGAIALEVIPPEVSTPVLTTPVASDVSMTNRAPVAVPSPASTQEVSTPVAEVEAPPKDITSLTELAGTQSPQPLALSRETAREALVNAEKLNQFRVLPLTVSEYQRLWQESGSARSLAPVHGFVDYGQNVIAVVVTRGEVEQVGSAAAAANNIQPLDQVAAPVLVEVSAQPIQPEQALGQS